MSETLSIGQLAERFGLNASAIRYYERAGVLPAPARTGGQRRYDGAAVKRVEVLETAKRAGFSLDEARLLVERRDAGTPAFASLRELSERKLPEIEALIARAELMRTWLLTAMDCSCESFDACSLFDGDATEPGHASAGR
jgi:MerR family redox-sensitive transcriptional activator SoxR